MEPMSLGSPGGSPASSSQYLPAFLLGEQVPTQSPQRNNMSSNENLCFGSSRTLINQTTKFANGTTTPQDHSTPKMKNSFGGPPILDLYDDMPQAVHSLSTSRVYTSNPNPTSPNHISNNSVHHNAYGSPNNLNYFNDYDARNSMNMSNLFKSQGNGGVFMEDQSYVRSREQENISFNGSYMSPKHREGEFWVTVLGFPSELAPSILDFFKRCGVVKDMKLIPGANYLNIRYTSRFERQEALSFNGKMFSQNVMLGVIPCLDPDLVNYENLNKSDDNMDLQCKLEKIKMLTSPKSASRSQYLMDNYRQNQLRGTVSQNRPANRPEGVLTRAMEYFFGS